MTTKAEAEARRQRYEDALYKLRSSKAWRTAADMVASPHMLARLAKEGLAERRLDMSPSRSSEGVWQYRRKLK